MHSALSPAMRPSPCTLTHSSVQPTVLPDSQCSHPHLYQLIAACSHSAPSPARLPSPSGLTDTSMSSVTTLSMIVSSLPVPFWPLPLPAAISWRLAAFIPWAIAFHLVLWPKVSLRDYDPDLATRSHVYMSQPGCHGISGPLRTQGSSQRNSQILQLK